MLPDMMLRKRHGWHSSDQDTKRQQACSKQELLLLQAGRGAAVKGGRLPAAAVAAAVAAKTISNTVLAVCLDPLSRFLHPSSTAGGRGRRLRSHKSDEKQD